jgi:hypothetical protein
MIATRIICKFLAALALGVSFAGADSSSREIVGDFLHNYCFDCHDSASEKGEREFESLKIPLESIQDLVAAREIIDQITLKEMPPRKKDQPSDEERLEVLRVLRSEVEAARGRFASNGGKTVMRRLSNREYENTLEVLFGRRVDTLGLTADFPKEKTSRHIDTIGESLVTSGFLLDQYFQAAHRLVENRLGKPTMKAKDWHFTIILSSMKSWLALTGLSLKINSSVFTSSRTLIPDKAVTGI